MSDRADTPFAILTKTSFSADGSRAYLTFTLPDNSNVSFRVLYECYTQSVRGRAAFTPEDMAFLEAEDDYSSALSSAFSILSFGGNTSREVYVKLKAKKYKEESALRVLDTLGAHGYIDEKTLCKEEIKRCLSKKWGRTKIMQKLMSRGFKRSVLSAAERTLDKLDFEKGCLELAEKKYECLPEDYAERQKLYSYLVRFGYTSDVIRNTMNKMKTE